VSSNEDEMPVFLDDRCSEMVDGYAQCRVGPEPYPLIVSAYPEDFPKDVQLAFTIHPADGGPSSTDTYLVHPLPDPASTP
jgi:hypothetical protein